MPLVLGDVYFVTGNVGNRKAVLFSSQLCHAFNANERACDQSKGCMPVSDNSEGVVGTSLECFTVQNHRLGSVDGTFKMIYGCTEADLA